MRSQVLYRAAQVQKSHECTKVTWYLRVFATMSCLCKQDFPKNTNLATNHRPGGQTVLAHNSSEVQLNEKLADLWLYISESDHLTQTSKHCIHITAKVPCMSGNALHLEAVTNTLDSTQFNYSHH